MTDFLDKTYKDGLIQLPLWRNSIPCRFFEKNTTFFSDFKMSDYNDDFRHFKKLNDVFEKKGKALNQLGIELYAEKIRDGKLKGWGKGPESAG